MRNTTKKHKPAAPVKGANPPAFPTGPIHDATGATMRDLFAAFAPPVPLWFQPLTGKNTDNPLARLVAWRFAYAEQMLIGRASR